MTVLRSSSHDKATRICLALLVCQTLPSCKKLNETYDPWRRYEACEHRLDDDHIRRDVGDAIHRKDYRLLGGYSNADPYPDFTVAMNQSCKVRSAAVINSDRPIHLKKDEGIDGSSRASLCREALDRYAFAYNRTMLALHPSAFALTCAP